MSLPQTHHVIQINSTSDSLDVIEYAEVETPRIESPHDIIVKNAYAGVNFIEAYFRKGIYPVSSFPYILGREASGTVVAVGSEVADFKVGDQIAYFAPSTFAEYTKINSVKTAYKLHNASDHDLKVYSSVIVGGLTALTFVEEAHKVQKGEYILVWAAAGGVGRLIVQLAAQRGAHVIAIASTKEKLDLAANLGAEYVINYKTEDVVAKVKEYTNGKGVAATFDSVGKDSFDTSLASLAPKGTFVSYGNASGPVPPISIHILTQKNIRLLRPTVANYISEREDFVRYFESFKEQLESGKLDFDISGVYELRDYRKAAGELEGGRTTGKLVLRIGEHL